MNNLLFYFAVIILLISCTGSEIQNKYLTYQNIVIISDLSSRIENKPQKDTTEIKKLIEFFKNDCVKPGEKIGDNSSIHFSSFSNSSIASIDLGKIKYLGEKQQFINSTGKYEKNGFDFQLKDFERKVQDAYQNIRNNGLDLISLLAEKIENEPIVKTDTYLTEGLDTTFISYENNFYIFTDGYLEYLNKNINNEFYFGKSEIDKVRQFCLSNNTDINQALQNNRELGLPPIKSKKAKFINSTMSH